MRAYTRRTRDSRAYKRDYRYLFSLLFFTFFVTSFFDFGQLLFLVLHHFFHLLAAFLCIVVKNILAVLYGLRTCRSRGSGSKLIRIQYLCIAVIHGSVHLCSAKFTLFSVIGYL